MNNSDNQGVTVHLGGELSFATVPTLSKNNRNLILKNPRVIFDLSQVTASDNTAVALLVALTSYAKSIKKEISFINLPSQLLDLIAAAKVKKILPLV